MRAARYFTVAVVVLALAACGGASKLDTAKLNREIARGVEKQTGTKDVRVTCPEDIEQTKGDGFECDVTAAGGLKAKIDARQTDDEGNVDWKLAKP